MNLLQMSLQAGLLIAAIVVVRAVALNRLPKTTFLILWGVALFRMLVPFSFSSKWSLYRFFTSGTSTNVLSPNAISGAVREAAQAEGDAIQHSSLFMIWFGVMLLLAVLLSLWLLLNYQHLRFSMLIKDNKLIEEWAAMHKLRRPLKIMRTDRITAPLSVGIVRPRIILPKAMDLENRKLVHYVLTHEDPRTCRIVGAAEVFEQKMRDEKPWEYYKRAYKKYYARMMKGNMSADEFAAWRTQGEQLRDKALEAWRSVDTKDIMSEALRADILAQLKKALNEK